MTRIELLADAFASLNDFLNPESKSFSLRNPGMLKGFIPSHPVDDAGFRVFKSVIDGYQALYFDLMWKCSKKNRAKLTPESTILNLVLAYGHTSKDTEFIVNFLRKAFGDEKLSQQTTLSFFNEA